MKKAKIEVVNQHVSPIPSERETKELYTVSIGESFEYGMFAIKEIKDNEVVIENLRPSAELYFSIKPFIIPFLLKKNKPYVNPISLKKYRKVYIYDKMKPPTDLTIELKEIVND
jgi:hypothetical protein